MTDSILNEEPDPLFDPEHEPDENEKTPVLDRITKENPTLVAKAFT